MYSEFERYLMSVSGAKDCEEQMVIQSLWSGYGKISRYRLEGAKLSSVVVKRITSDRVENHPRGWNTKRSHERKLKSYLVETNWYEKWASECPKASRIPQLIGVFEKGVNRWIVLEDLEPQFPIRKTAVETEDIYNCLLWMAQFHAKFLNRTPNKLWSVGTYWHLDTRPDEWRLIENEELKEKASKIDQELKGATFQTIVHGDAKLANFCFDDTEKAVAAVDFQYVGGGCGMKDVAYFLGSCLSENMLKEKEHELLEYYFIELRRAVSVYHPNIKFENLEIEWRRLYRYAVADFVRFMMGWMPGHEKVNGYSLKLMKEVLRELD